MSNDLFEMLDKKRKGIKFINRGKAYCVTPSKEVLPIFFSCAVHLKMEHCSWDINFHGGTYVVLSSAPRIRLHLQNKASTGSLQEHCLF